MYSVRIVLARKECYYSFTLARIHFVKEAGTFTPPKYTETEREDSPLKEGVFLVEGSNRGALYDTTLGNVYSINREAAQIINGEVADESFWNQLAEIGLLENSDERRRSADRETRSVGLEFVWLEVTDRCNKLCLHCYGSFSPADLVDNGQSLNHFQWKSLIEQIFLLDCRRIQFIGGEPLMYRGTDSAENVFDLIGYTRTLGFEAIELFTNATMLTDKLVEKIKDLGVAVAVSLYSSFPEIHDQVTQIPGSHRLTMRAISKLLENDIPLRVGLVVMRQNQETLDETMAVLNDLGVRFGSPDILRPSGRGDDADLIPAAAILKKYGLMMSPNFRVSRERFERNQHYHPCLAGKVAITTNGTVLPCIFARDQELGNINDALLGEVINNTETKQVWQTTKDDVLVCRDCEYRYACHDCRPLASACSGQSEFYEAPSPRCTYNPYTGEWGQGVWRVENNEVVYKPLVETGEEVK